MEKDDIKKLADLSRIELKDEEIDSLATDMTSILGYISELNTVSGDVTHSTSSDAFVDNVFREDTPIVAVTDPATIIAEAPETEDGYVKVKKILNGTD